LPTIVITLSGVTIVAEQAEFVHRAGDPADAHEVTHFHWPQDEHEGPRREVAEQAAPGGADRDASAGEHGGERGGLDPK